MDDLNNFETDSTGDRRIIGSGNGSLSQTIDINVCEDKNNTGQRSSNWDKKWTVEEDQLLIQGLREFGEDWCQVAKKVGTRNHTTCWQRWDKVLRPGLKKGRWTEAEDRELVRLITKGHTNWGKLARCMPNRSSKQCRERWNNYLDPSLNHTPFTEEEDIQLLQLQETHGNKWATISRYLPGRTEAAVKLRFNFIKKHGLFPSIDVNPAEKSSSGPESLPADTEFQPKKPRVEPEAAST